MMITLKTSLLFSLSLLFHCANAFNITTLLNQHPGFTTFNNFLTQTQLDRDINSRSTITVLAVENAALSPLSGKPANELKSILSVHVVLDYFDVARLQNLPKKTAILTTLFQSSGKANNQQGFLNVTNLGTGGIVFGSAAKGATLGANLVKSVAAQPYNISVLQISSAIIPMGVANSSTNSSSNSTPPSLSPSPVPSPSLNESMTPPTASPADTPSMAPGPFNAENPSPAGTAPAPSDNPADAPSSNGPAADAPADAADTSPSAGAPPRIGLGLVAMIALSTLCLTWMI